MAKTQAAVIYLFAAYPSDHEEKNQFSFSEVELHKIHVFGKMCG